MIPYVVSRGADDEEDDRDSWTTSGQQECDRFRGDCPYGTVDDTGRVQLSQDVMTKRGVGDATLPTGSSKVPGRKIRKMPAKKVSWQ